MLDDFFRTQLESLAKENRLRQLPQSVHGIDFCSNDYLGLARTQQLFDDIQEKVGALQFKQNGATGSRLLSGNSNYTTDIEEKLSRIFNSESSLIFNSGYSANLAVLSSIPQRGDTIIYDELAHTCIKDGARLSLAHRHSFKHNDLADLEGKLINSKGRKFIAIESIYSMDGDQCPLKEVVTLAKRYHAFIILDEAHSTGIMGTKGSGMASWLEIENQIDIRVYTFGKAMGIHGACVAGSSQLIQFLINYARPFIYTTALPPHSMVAIECAFAFLEQNIHLQKKLSHKIDLFNKYTLGLRNKMVSHTSIQSVIIPGNDNVKKAAARLQARNFDVRPILSPTVAADSERIRICLHSYNEDQHIIDLASQLIELSLSSHSAIH